LVGAARELFVERDFELVTTAEILERSGVSRGALYHHFPSKVDLFRAVYEASEWRVLGLLATDMAAAETPFGALLAGARAYLRLAERDEEFRRIGLTQARTVFGWARWRAAAEQIGIAAARAAVEAALEAEELRPVDPEAAALILIGVLLEAAMPIVHAEDRAAARARSEAVVVALLEGLRR
jgi:AcrR family transcriptional regulator